MSASKSHPTPLPTKFEPGAPVAYTVGWSDNDWKVRKVGKVYKNGNFVLEGDASKQQYKPSSRSPYGAGDLVAWRTGDHYSRARVMLLDAAGRKVMEHDLKQAKHNKRVRDLRDRMQVMLLEKHVNKLSSNALALLEQALAVQADYERNFKPHEVKADV